MLRDITDVHEDIRYSQYWGSQVLMHQQDIPMVKYTLEQAAAGLLLGKWRQQLSLWLDLVGGDDMQMHAEVMPRDVWDGKC